MAEILQAQLQLELNQFTNALQQAASQVQAFAQAVKSPMESMARIFADQVTQINQVAEASMKSAQAVIQAARAEAVERKRANDDMHQQYVAIARFERQLAKESFDLEKAWERDAAETVKRARQDASEAFKQAKQQERDATKAALADHKARIAQETQMEREFGKLMTQLAREEANKRTADEQSRLAKAKLLRERDLADQKQWERDAQSERIRMAREGAEIRKRIDQEEAAQRRASQRSSGGGSALMGGILGAVGSGNVLGAAGGAAGSMLFGAGPLGAGAGLLFAKMANDLKDLAASAIQTTMRIQDLRAAFVAIEGSGAGADKSLGFLFKTAQRFGVEFEGIADGFKRLDVAAKGTTISAEELKVAFANIIGGARAMGASSNQVQHAIVALEQMLTKGRLSAEEYRRQLGNAIPAALTLMAKGFGVTTQVMEQMIKSGLIPADAAVVAFGKSMGEVAQKGESIDRLSSTFNRLKNETTAWLSAIGEGIASKLTPFLHWITEASEKLRSLYGIGTPGVQGGGGGGGIAASLINIGKKINFFPKFGGSGGGSTAPTADIQQLITQYATASGIDPAIFGAMIRKESGFNQSATGPVITKGRLAGDRAYGLGQIMGTTGAGYGASIDELMDPDKNLRISAKHLAKQMQFLVSDFGKVDDLMKFALASYNAGYGHVRGGLKNLQAQGKPLTWENLTQSGALPQPGQTVPYVNTIMGWAGKATGAATSAGQELDPFKHMSDNITKTTGQIKELEKQMDNIQKMGKDFGGLGYEELRGTLKKDAKEVLDTYSKTIQLLVRFPDLYEKMTPAQKEQLRIAGEHVKRIDDRIDAEDKALKEAQAAERKLAQDKIKLTEDFTEKSIQITQSKFEKERYQLEQDLERARKAGVDKTLIDQYGAAERMRIAQEEGQEKQRIHKLEAEERRRVDKEYTDFTQTLAQLESKATRSRVDDYDAMIAERREKFEFLVKEEIIDIEQLNKFEIAATRGRNRILEDEQKKLNKEYERSWKDLANTIEHTLAGAFESILKGSKNIFEGIRDAFIKLLAKLAADALTHQVIIPFVMKMFGGGGGGAAGAFAGFGAAAGMGAMGGEGGMGGMGGGGSMLGTAMGMAKQGYSLYSGLSGNSIFGGGGALGGLMSMPASEIPVIGGLFGGSAPAGVQGPSMASGSFYSGGSLGGLLGAAGTGIAVGQLASQLMGMLGLKGTANRVVSGTLGGATAGTMVMPGIGTAIGAAIGALGGWMSGLFGSKKKPEFEMKEVQPGAVGFDQLQGFHITQQFKILRDHHQKLGTDYEDLMDELNNGINSMFEQVTQSFGGLSPQLQKAVVHPLNAAMQTVADQIEGIGEMKGNDLLEQIQKVMEKDIPGFFTDAANGLFKRLEEAVKKIDPLVRGFDEVIGKFTADLNALKEQQKALHDTLQGNILSLKEAFYSPAQTYMAREKDYKALREQFYAGTQEEKARLAPRLGQSAQQLLELAKNENVLGQDPLLLRQLQADLVATMQDVQQITDRSYETLEGALQEQIDIANHQIDILTGSLENLDSVDATASQSLAVLQQLQSYFGGGGQNDPLSVAQTALLAHIGDTGTAQLDVLRSIDAKVGGGGAVGGGGGGAPASPYWNGDTGAGDSFAKGTRWVNRNMFAFLHQGEMVVPKHEVNAGTGTNINIHVNGGNSSGDDIAEAIIKKIERRSGRIQGSSIQVARR